MNPKAAYLSAYGTYSKLSGSTPIGARQLAIQPVERLFEFLVRYADDRLEALIGVPNEFDVPSIPLHRAVPAPIGGNVLQAVQHSSETDQTASNEHKVAWVFARMRQSDRALPAIGTEKKE